LYLFGYDSTLHQTYYLTISGGKGVKVVYSCLGIGLFSFWTSFVYANRLRLKEKLRWIVIGLSVIFLLNVIRIALLVLSVNLHWPPLLSLDHHTLFNIAAYTAIFIMMYFFDKSQRKYRQPLPTQHAAQEITHLH
jgi:exosortase/archaeosortase family protein